MDRRFSRETSMNLQKKLADSKKPHRAEPVPDLTDFMNDMFFGAVKNDPKAYNLIGADIVEKDEEFDSSTRSNSSRLTQEWLEEAKRMVASSPARCDSPARLLGSPRFAAAQPTLDRRDPLSRSARRNRGVERSFSGEILSKSARHTSANSATFSSPATCTTVTATSPVVNISPASAVQKWFSSILRPPHPQNTDPKNTQNHDQNLISREENNQPSVNQDQMALSLPPRQPLNRKSRFQNSQPHQIHVQPRRSFKILEKTGDQILSPPKNLIESAHRRSLSASNCSTLEKELLSPPRNLVESAHRRSISSSTCSISKISPALKVEERENPKDLNGFLKDQRIRLESISNGEMQGKAKIVLSGNSNSTSSMVAAIGCAWLLENKKEDGEVVVPVINIKRQKMWKQRQAAWLFHHVGLDANALLFSDEVDLESLMMARQLVILVVGQDVLKTNGEVGSQCTMLTDNYCEDAYDLLQSSVLKKLLVAGILLDTQNLNVSAKLSMTRDAEAVQLLLAGSAPYYRNTLYDQLVQDQKDGKFYEALRHNYGKPLSEMYLADRNGGAPMEHKVPDRKSTSSSHHEASTQNSDKNSHDAKSVKSSNRSQKSGKQTPSPTQAPTAAPAQAANDASRKQNKPFFLAKWFGFGQK